MGCEPWKNKCSEWLLWLLLLFHLMMHCATAKVDDMQLALTAVDLLTYCFAYCARLVAGESTVLARLLLGNVQLFEVPCGFG